jgi:Cu/Ag efflux pump CusA
LIDKLLELSIRARALVILLSIVFIVLGLLASRRVPIDAVPDVTNVQVKVITAAPALGPVDVETYITFPIEMAMAGLPRVEEIRSLSRAGISSVTIVFEEGVDVYFARQLVNERLAQAKNDIPEGYGTPQIGPISTGLGEVFHFEVRGETQSLMELRTILDWQISPRLRMVPGIVEVNVFGGESQTLEVTLDPERLAAARLGVAEVVKAIEKNHAAAGGGWLPDGREHVTIRGEARVRSPDDLGNIVVDRRDGRTPVYVKDLGSIRFAPRVRYGAVTRDGRGEAVVGVAMMLLGANSGEVVERVKETIADVEKTLKQFPEVTTVVCRTGRAEIAIDPMGMNMTDIYVLLKPREQWTTASDREGLVKAFDKALSTNVPGAGWSFTQPIEMNTNDLLAGISSDLALHIYGDDLGSLKRVAERAVRILRDIPGAADVRTEQIAGSSVLDVRVDRAAVARAGLDAEDVLKTVAALGGVEAGVIVEGTKRYPIQVRLAGAARASVDAVAALPVRTPEGGVAPLGHLASVSVEPGPAQISRERLQRRTTVQLNVRGRDIGSFVEDAKKALDKDLGLPTGYATAWAGEYERLQHAAARMAIIIPITLTIILVLLVTTFGRISPALLILLNVPTAVTGGVAALALRGMELSISAAVGFIALFGVAVLNGLVLVSTIERRRAAGDSIDVAVAEGAKTRVRPVLTTALVASLGFLPMALATGAGAEVQRPLATVIVGGILSSTVQTLLVFPAIYALMARRQRAAAAPPATAQAA